MTEAVSMQDGTTLQAAATISHSQQRNVPKPAELFSKHMDNAKQEEWTAIADRTRPLEFLDLPVDILQNILREVTHTNDLTALALTHSSLHNIVIPHIYSRFDIVWPEASTHVETRVGVDALTYGLATLVMASDVFGEAPYQQHRPRVSQTSTSLSTQPPRKIRRGNHFAQYTRKFSLGNGPAEWVQEYLISKEGGKMLGTLAALAVGRMRNLEAFIWDMPTGVLRDVWLALASLGDRDDGQPCRLEKVWVRFHDNSEQGPLPSPTPPGASAAPQPPSVPSLLTGSAQTLFQIPPYPRVEFPTFSILPPLKSVTVLEIDELPYAEELSVLINRSLPELRELRVGMAKHAQFDMWATPSEDQTIPSSLPPVDPSVIRPGGILGILVSQFCDQFRSSGVLGQSLSSSWRNSKPGFHVEESLVELDEDTVLPSTPILRKSTNREPESPEISQIGQLMSNHTINDQEEDQPLPLSIPKRGQEHAKGGSDQKSSIDAFKTSLQAEKNPSRMRLELLELERVPLSIKVLSRAIDWSRLTSLTLLGCRNHETLWKELRKQFVPLSRMRSSSASTQSVSTSLAGLFSTSRNTTPSFNQIPADEYVLKLRRLHTDTVSPALIAFIKDALAPDSLEWLFLQNHASCKSNISIDMIYKGAIRRHRGSLKKLLIDSEIRRPESAGDPSWKHWVANRELLNAITGGKMKLRELSVSIDYKDWHFFLQRLPNATTIRSLHIPHIAEHVQGIVDSKEAALQVLDIVSLRPDVELCYLGIQKQCFEVLEYTSSTSRNTGSIIQSGLDSDDEDEPVVAPVGHDDSDLEMTSSDGEETEDEGHNTISRPSFRLREILFYDDKVSIFRARHGKL